MIEFRGILEITIKKFNGQSQEMQFRVVDLNESDIPRILEMEQFLNRITDARFHIHLIEEPRTAKGSLD